MKTKRIYEFVVNKEEEIEESIDSKDDSGGDIKIVKKIKKEVPKKFFIKKPERSLVEEGQLFFASTFSEYIKKGLLTKAMLAKSYADNNGIWSESDKQDYANSFVQLVAAEQDLINLNKEDQSSPDIEKLIKEKEETRNKLRLSIQKYGQVESNLFEQTADMKARDKTVFWWTLMLAYSDDDKPFLGDGDFKIKVSKLDELEDKEDLFTTKVLRKFSTLIGLWYIGLASTQKDFEKFDAQFEGENGTAAK